MSRACAHRGLGCSGSDAPLNAKLRDMGCVNANPIDPECTHVSVSLAGFDWATLLTGDRQAGDKIQK